jgi:hypothetical protein
MVRIIITLRYLFAYIWILRTVWCPEIGSLSWQCFYQTTRHHTPEKGSRHSWASLNSQLVLVINCKELWKRQMWVSSFVRECGRSLITDNVGPFHGVAQSAWYKYLQCNLLEIRGLWGYYASLLVFQFLLANIRLISVFDFITEFILISFTNVEEFSFGSASRCRLIDCSVCISVNSLLLPSSSLVRHLCLVKKNSLLWLRGNMAVTIFNPGIGDTGGLLALHPGLLSSVYNLRFTFTSSLVGPQSWSAYFGEEQRRAVRSPKIKLRFLCRPVSCLVRLLITFFPSFVDLGLTLRAVSS